MPLKTVRAPAEMEQAFLAAEQLVSRFFKDRRDDPERGTIEVFGERYVLVRAAALSVEFFALVNGLYGPGREEEANAFARNILYDLAHSIGKADARNLHEKMQLTDPVERQAAGPVHFAYTGWAFVDIEEETTRIGEDYCRVYDHPYSFESDAWLRAGRRADFPVCIMNAGYSSGWCEESFGIELAASEVLCRARGDDRCHFVMAPPHQLEALVARYLATRPEIGRRVGQFEAPDFFARKRAEEELRKSHAELEVRVRERTAELLESNQRLQREIEEREQVEARLRQTQKLEAIGRLAGGVAHDFNNLMSIVLTRGSLLEQRLPADPRLGEEVAQILDAARRAAGLTKQLLAFGRIGVLQPELLDFSGVVRELGRTLLPLIGEQIELQTDLDADAGWIEADRGQIEQVVMNLVVNARDAMPAGGMLSVRAFACELAAPKAVATGELAPGRYAALSVVDTGVGMDRETLSKVFDPFFTTKPLGQGTGLGLSTVHGVVLRCGGAIDVASAPGVGTRFELYFPRAARAGAAAQQPARERGVERGSETVLLVEDQKQLRTALGEALQALGYRVLIADSPEHALELAEQRAAEIALLLTDVVMPKMGGRELAEHVRARVPGVQVLFMSGYAADEALRMGVLDRTAVLLPKPFAPSELARKIRELLD